MASERDDRIALDVSNIRTAVYGVEVRESIADGIEQCHEESKSTETTVEEIASHVSEELANVKQDIAATQIIREISGDGVWFDDGSDGIPCQSVVVDISPLQDGDGEPSPNNIRPIIGVDRVKITRCHTNIWDEEWENGYFSYTGIKSNSPTAIRSKDFSLCTPKTSYYAFCGNTTSALYVLWYDANQNFIVRQEAKNKVIESPINARYFKISTDPNYTESYEQNISVNYPATDVLYHPFRGNTYDVIFPSEVGTVYGGTLDVTSGKIKVNKAYVLLNDPDKWSASTGSIDYVYNVQFQDRKIYDNSYSGLICSYMSTDPIDSSKRARWSGVTAYFFGLKWTDGSLEQIKTDAAAGKIAICYDLAERVSYALTPAEINTFLGKNGILANIGNITVDYTADTKSFIQNATESSGEEIVDKFLTASFSKTYATTEANQQISLNFNLYAVAGSTITIEQTAGSVVAGSQYTVTTTPAKTGETSMNYGGVVQTTQRFKYSFTTSVDLQKVNLVAIVNAQAVHAFKITYIPGANQIANEKPSLTLYEGHNAVTMTAAQLRQLLALLN